MKRILVGMLGLLLCAGGAGCQPILEADIVVYKGQSASGMIPNNQATITRRPPMWRRKRTCTACV